MTMETKVTELSEAKLDKVAGGSRATMEASASKETAKTGRDVKQDTTDVFASDGGLGTTR